MREVCSSLNIKTSEQRVFIVSLSFIWTDFSFCSGVSISDFELVNGAWDVA